MRNVGKEWNFQLLLPSLNGKRHTQRVLRGRLGTEQRIHNRVPMRTLASSLCEGQARATKYWTGQSKKAFECLEAIPRTWSKISLKIN